MATLPRGNRGSEGPCGPNGTPTRPPRSPYVLAHCPLPARALGLEWPQASGRFGTGSSASLTLLTLHQHPSRCSEVYSVRPASAQCARGQGPPRPGSGSVGSAQAWGSPQSGCPCCCLGHHPGPPDASWTLSQDVPKPAGPGGPSRVAASCAGLGTMAGNASLAGSGQATCGPGRGGRLPCASQARRPGLRRPPPPGGPVGLVQSCGLGNVTCDDDDRDLLRLAHKAQGLPQPSPHSAPHFKGTARRRKKATVPGGSLEGVLPSLPGGGAGACDGQDRGPCGPSVTDSWCSSQSSRANPCARHLGSDVHVLVWTEPGASEAKKNPSCGV